MADIVTKYSALSTSSPRSDVASVLQLIIVAPTPTINSTSRVKLIETILKDVLDVFTDTSTKSNRLVEGDVVQALKAVKMLGRDPSGSQFLSTRENLSHLLSLCSSLLDNAEALGETLRTIANVLLLIAPARDALLEQDDGGRFMLSLLEKATAVDQIHLTSRILFFCTASGPPFVQSMIEEDHAGRTFVAIATEKLDLLRDKVVAGMTMASDAMVDLLKLVFNVLVHYPKMVASEPQTEQATDANEHKVMGDFWSFLLDGLLPPLIRIFFSLPPTTPVPIAAPLTHVIHSLIIIPVPPLLPIWLNTSPSLASPAGTPPIDVLKRAWDLLELSLAHFLPNTTDPDSKAVRHKNKAETGDSSLDDVIAPIAVLIARLCAGDTGSRARVRQWLVPEDLNRSHSLERRRDTLGRCLRLLPSVYHPRSRDSVGEMLYAMADSDAWTLSALVGYGNVAGFLFQKGVMNAPDRPSHTNVAPNLPPLMTPSGHAINPITGMIVEPPIGMPDLTDEEKESEIEKLMVLFDRLERTGAITPEQNPMRKVVRKAMFGEP